MDLKDDFSDIMWLRKHHNHDHDNINKKIKLNDQSKIEIK